MIKFNASGGTSTFNPSANNLSRNNFVATVRSIHYQYGTYLPKLDALEFSVNKDFEDFVCPLSYSAILKLVNTFTETHIDALSRAKIVAKKPGINRILRGFEHSEPCIQKRNAADIKQAYENVFKPNKFTWVLHNSPGAALAVLSKPPLFIVRTLSTSKAPAVVDGIFFRKKILLDLGLLADFGLAVKTALAEKNFRGFEKTPEELKTKKTKRPKTVSSRGHNTVSMSERLPAKQQLSLTSNSTLAVDAIPSLSQVVLPSFEPVSRLVETYAPHEEALINDSTLPDWVRKMPKDLIDTYLLARSSGQIL